MLVLVLLLLQQLTKHVRAADFYGGRLPAEQGLLLCVGQCWQVAGTSSRRLGR